MTIFHWIAVLVFATNGLAVYLNWGDNWAWVLVNSIGFACGFIIWRNANSIKRTDEEFKRLQDRMNRW